MALKSDITDELGNVIIKSGTKVNPLTHTSLRSILLFYDGDVKDQVNWAIRQDRFFQGKTKLILVNGFISKQIQLFKKRIYFDQYGRLTNKLQIKYVPAIARQEGLRIRVQEVLP
jgi:conjugal transfer pilus assembly protein TraW